MRCGYWLWLLVTLCWLGMNDIHFVPFRNSRAYTRIAHHIRSYGLSQFGAITLATGDLATEEQRSSLKMPFNCDWSRHTLTMLGEQGYYARNIPMQPFRLVTDCDKVWLTWCSADMKPYSWAIANVPAGERDWLICFSLLLFAIAFEVNRSFWSISSVPLRKYNPGSLYFRIYLRSLGLTSSCRRSWQILNNFIAVHYQVAARRSQGCRFEFDSDANTRWYHNVSTWYDSHIPLVDVRVLI